MAKRGARKKAAVTAPHAVHQAQRFAWAPIIVVLAGLVGYANSLTGPFLFDDQRAIVQNASIRLVSSAINPPPQTPLTGRPLPNLLFAANYAIDGLNVQGYHVVNVVLHLLAGLALFGVFRQTFGRLPSLKDTEPERLALFCALAWIVHPLNTESVDYLTQRTELMMGLFVLASLYASIRAIHSDQVGRWQIIAGLGALAGVASKEGAVIVPIAVVLWDRAFAFSSFAAAWTRRRGLYAMLAASWLLFVFLARGTPFFSPAGFREHVSGWTYLLNQGPMILRYLGLALWPGGLVFDYGVTTPVTLAQVWPAVAVVSALFGVSVVAFIRCPASGFWGAWFFLTLAPASSVIPIPTEVGAERRMYLPLIGVIVLVAMAVMALLRRVRADRVGAQIGWVLSAAVVVALTTLTITRNADYRDGLTLWQTVLDRRPQPRAHEHISMFLRDAGKIDESIAHLRIAAPDSSNARHALASALLEQGHVKEAIVEFKTFVAQNSLDPTILDARREYAAALLRDHDVEGVIGQYRELLRLQPRDLEAHRSLLLLLLDQHHFAEAEAEGRTLVGLSPNDAVTHNLLGAALGSQNRVAEAREQFAEAVRLDPSYQDARDNLARSTQALR